MLSEQPIWVRLWRSKAQRGFLVAAAIALLACGFLPLFGGYTYEYALAGGLVLPLCAALATALHVARARPAPLEAWSLGVASGFAFGLAATLVGLAHGLRAGFCSPVEGFALFALGPWAGAVLGGVWGSASGLVSGGASSARRRVALAIVLGLAGPLGGVLVSLWRFYTSPMVFAFDPFFGYFGGPLYDTILKPLPVLATYRAGSAFTLLASACCLAQLERSGNGRLHLVRRVRGRTVAGVLALLASIALSAFGPELGHYSTTASIRSALGRELSSQRCRVYYSKPLLGRDVQLLARECDAHVRELEQFFDTAAPERIDVYLFATAEEKRALTGAGTTQIAKPWRREIYILADTYTHPVLGHELAHVIAGQFGAGPFRVAGPLGGLLPDPGRIEGIAVAASPPDDTDLSLQAWAKTLLELELMPELNRVFKLSFLSENSSTAYTVAGAFVDWFRGRFGVAALRSWYGGAELEAVTGGRTLRALEREWHGSLRAIQVSPEALYAARLRFDRPAIFGRRCPHVVDELEQRAVAELAVNDAQSARETLTELLALDPAHTRARLALGTCAVRQAKLDEARQRYGAIASDPSLPRLVQAAAAEALADLELMLGNAAQARQRYQTLAKLALDGDRKRALDVKSVPDTELERAAILNLLVGGPRFGPTWDVAAIQLGQWSERQPALGLADYLLGRGLYLRGRWSDAARHLDRALGRRLEPASVASEALRLRAVVACALGEPERAAPLIERWRQQPQVSSARVASMSRVLARCRAH